MPKMVSEITQGASFEFSSDDTAASAQTARVFRLIKTEPAEYINIPLACGVPIGSEHPAESGLFCTSFSVAYEGESRMVLLATFNYRTTPSQSSSDGNKDPKNDAPDIRPANWYTTSSIIEVPAQTWEFSSGGSGLSNPDLAAALAGGPTATINPVGDLYEVVTKPTAVVTIHIDQWENEDPTKHCLHVGKTNNKTELLGSLSMARRTIMFRGVQSRPATESWGGVLYRGWNCSYEFLYKPNICEYHFGAIGLNVVNVTKAPVGWDVLQPLSGFNVRAFNPAGAAAEKDPYGQPLKTYGSEATGNQVPGQIVGTGNDGQQLALPDGIAVGDKVRATVKIGITGGYTGQRPSAQPIPLNPDGTPRAETADPKVIVFRYKVTEEIDFKTTFKLRLY